MEAEASSLLGCGEEEEDHKHKRKLETEKGSEGREKIPNRLKILIALRLSFLRVSRLFSLKISFPQTG